MSVLRELNDGSLQFQCPGCGMRHFVYHKQSTNEHMKSHPIWGWNGSMDKPTFTPSINVEWTREGKKQICHSFVKDGGIQFLNDCTHPLAGKTVDLQPW